MFAVFLTDSGGGSTGLKGINFFELLPGHSLSVFCHCISQVEHLQTTLLTSSQFCRSEVQTLHDSLSLFSVSQRNQGISQLCSHLEAPLRKNPLPGSFRLLENPDLRGGRIETSVFLWLLFRGWFLLEVFRVFAV